MKTNNEEGEILTYNVNVKIGDEDYTLEYIENIKEIEIRNLDQDTSICFNIKYINKFIKALNKFKEINNL